MTSRRSQYAACIRVGIIGAGKMGFWHGRTARHLGAQLIAVADPDVGRAKALARVLQIKSVATDPADLLQKDRLDAVHICTPTSRHFALALKAIENGVHALVEKPLAETAEETRRLFELAGQKAVLLCPVHQIAFQEGMAVAMGALAGLGAVSAIDFRICSAGGAGRPDGELDDIVTEILPHPLSVLRVLWPEASWRPQNWFVSHPRPGDLLVGGEHAGAALSILVSMHARPTSFEMTVRGSHGSIQLDLFHGFAVQHNGRVSRLDKAFQPFASALKQFGAATTNLVRRGIHREVAYPGLRGLTRAFYAACRGAGPPPIPPEDVLAVADAADAILIRANPVLKRMHQITRPEDRPDSLN